MKGKNAMFDPQTKKFCSAVVDALPELSGDVMQGWIGSPKGLQKVLRDALCPSPVVVGKTATNLATFFTNRPGLDVSDDGFNHYILAPALKMKETSLASIRTPYDLPKNMYDGELRTNLGEGHVFKNARAFCRYLEDALTKQWGGRKGDLLITGRVNIFYVLSHHRTEDGEVLPVYVRWRAGDGEWGVEVSYPGIICWAHGDRAFPSIC